jgi:hypothetical protein
MKPASIYPRAPGSFVPHLIACAFGAVNTGVVVVGVIGVVMGGEVIGVTVTDEVIIFVSVLVIVVDGTVKLLAKYPTATPTMRKITISIADILPVAFIHNAQYYHS